MVVQYCCHVFCQYFTHCRTKEWTFFTLANTLHFKIIIHRICCLYFPLKYTKHVQIFCGAVFWFVKIRYCYMHLNIKICYRCIECIDIRTFVHFFSNSLIHFSSSESNLIQNSDVVFQFLCWLLTYRNTNWFRFLV